MHRHSHLVALRLRLGHWALFVITLTGHWIFGWFEQHAHQQPVSAPEKVEP